MGITYSWDERNNRQLPYIELTLTVKVCGEKFAASRRVPRIELDYSIAPERITAWVKQDMLRNISYIIAEHITGVVKV